MRKMKDKTMNKRGSAEIIGIIILASMLILGGLGSYKIISENRYVGDSFTKLIYDLSKCDISNIPKENQINFNNQKDIEGAIKNDYKLAECTRG